MLVPALKATRRRRSSDPPSQEAVDLSDFTSWFSSGVPTLKYRGKLSILRTRFEGQTSSLFLCFSEQSCVVARPAGSSSKDKRARKHTIVGPDVSSHHLPVHHGSVLRAV